MLAHELDFLKSCRELRGAQDSVRFAINYPTQSTASSIAALTGYELMQLARRNEWEIYIPGFIHDCLEGDFSHRHWVDVFTEMPRFAEEWPYNTFGLPVAMDFEIGVRGGPFLVEFKRNKDDRLFVRDGVMRAEFEGRKEAVELLLDRLRKHGRYDVEVTDVEEGVTYTSWSELYLKVASSINLSFGKSVPTQSGKIAVSLK